jgi:hypothetical protein
MFCRRDFAVLVGTDIFHGMILVIVATLRHLAIDQINLCLVGLLLMGSVGHESRFDSHLYGFAGCSWFLWQLAVS